jgi:hypothetical protein
MDLASNLTFAVFANSGFCCEFELAAAGPFLEKFSSTMSGESYIY